MSINHLFPNRLAASCVLCAVGLAGPALALNISTTQPEVQNELIAQDAFDLMVVTPDLVTLRCGDQDVFYAIGELKAGTRVQALGISESYTKILIPETVGAFVPANEVDAALDGKTVTLSFDSKLRAPSHLLGMSGSWKGMYAAPLVGGTTLDVIEIMKSDAGEVLGYRVIAPKGPDGELPIAYIRTDALRAATAAEIRAFTNSGDTTPSTTPIVDESPTIDPEPEVELAPETEVDDSMMDDMNLDEPVEIINAAPVDAQTDAQPDVVDEAEDSTRRTSAGGRITSSQLEDLEAAFANARRLPKAELDEALSELHAEFSRTRAQADSDSSLARALDQRIEWIDIRIESRDQRRAIQTALAAYDARNDVLNQQINDWQSGRAYSIVGRMVTSSVYTGERLALLYRIQAIDPVSGIERTIGYVAPRTGQDFRHMLGRIVGVVGSMHVDESLSLTVIDPDRIELMPE